MFYLHRILEVFVTPREMLVSFINVNNIILIVNDKQIENK